MASMRWTNDRSGRGHVLLRCACLLAATVAVVTLAGCGGSDGGSAGGSDSGPAAADSTASPVATDVVPTDAVATTVGAPTTTAAPATTAAPTTTATPTTIPPTTAPPDVLQQQPGVVAIEVSVSGTDPTRPTFSWAAVPGATSYELVVHAGDGTPLWAWTGADVTVPLGGVERGADQEGPTLTGPSTVRVYAFDAAIHLVAISPWTPTPAFT